ncbi:MAG: hypothetical protein WCA64_06285 [Gallionella sp.]
MNTTLISYFPLIILFVIYSVISVMHTAFVKLSGKMLHGSVVSWKHAFIFALSVTVILLIVIAATVAAGISVPPTVSMVFGFVLSTAFGSWFFSTRGMTQQGRPLGRDGGFRLSAIAFLLLAVTGAVMKGIVHVLAMAVHA